MDLKKLKRVSTIAKGRNKSSTWIYKEIKKGIHETVNIDGVTFIIID